MSSSPYPIVSLDDLAEKVDYGLTASATDTGNGPKFLRITDIQNDQVDWGTVPLCNCEKEDFDKYALAEGDIVFARTGATTGKSFLIRSCPPGAVFASYLIRVRPSAKVDPGYLARFFQTPNYWNQVNKSSTGTAQAGVNASNLKKLAVPLPPIAEQRRIAAILDRADAVRRKRQEAIALTEELLRSAFLEMFGDPVRNPKDWDIVSIESVAASSKNALAIGPFGSSLKVDDYKERGHPVVFVRDVRENQFNWISRVFVNDEKFQELQSHHVRPGDIVATKMGLPPCIAAVYPNSMPIGVVTADIIKVTLDHKKMTPTYAAAVINSDFCKGQVARFTEGITRPKVTLRDFKNLLVPCPPLDYQERWEKFAFQQQIAFSRLKSDLDNLNNLFNSLLQRAFRGEL